MTGWSDVRGEMEPSPDHWTADRLLSGKADPADAPAAWADVASLVRDARAPAEPHELAREAATVAAMVGALSGASTASHSHGVSSTLPTLRLRRLKLVAMAAAVMVLATAGLAFAGALPEPAQEVASIVLAKVGVSVPRGHSSKQQPEQGPLPPGPNLRGPAEYGLCAAYTSGQGGSKGKKNDALPFDKLQSAGQGPAEECVNASPGRGPVDAGRGPGGEHGPAVPTPSPGGPGTGDSASGGKGTDHNNWGRNPGP